MNVKVFRKKHSLGEAAANEGCRQSVTRFTIETELNRCWYVASQTDKRQGGISR